VSMEASGGIASYVGVDPSSPVDAYAERTDLLATSHPLPTVTTTSDHDRVVGYLGVGGAMTVTPASGMTERYVTKSLGAFGVGGTTSEMEDQTQTSAGTAGGEVVTTSSPVDQTKLATVALRPAQDAATVRYGFSGQGDTPDFTTDGSGTVIERMMPLVGGVLLTKRTSGGDVWSYPNIHGDVVATADASGVKQGPTLTYDPDGTPLVATPDNSAGRFDDAWLGSHQRGFEHAGNIATIEMGTRQYLPMLGRFLEADPVEGGSANDYDYVNGDPINNFDINGDYCLTGVARHETVRYKDKHGHWKTRQKEICRSITRGAARNARGAGHAIGSFGGDLRTLGGYVSGGINCLSRVGGIVNGGLGVLEGIAFGGGAGWETGGISIILISPYVLYSGREVFQNARELPGSCGFHTLGRGA
jgi:RHS repeat-associated protein